MLHPLIVGRPGTPDAEAAIASYVFSATLAIQDITGLAASGVSAPHVSKRLEGSAESQSMLFALSSRPAPRPLGELGYPVVGPDDALDVEAWVFVSLPLLEDLSIIEAHVTLDASIAPLPGEPIPAQPWHSALSLVDALSTALSRPTRHVWVTGAAPAALPERGYAAAFTETQAVLAVPACSGPTDVVHDMDVSPADRHGLQHVLTSSSRDYPRGGLVMDTVAWDDARLGSAAARLLDRGGAQVTALARDAQGQVVGMAEIVHYSSDSEHLCELGLVYVLPGHRRTGHAARMLRSAFAAARERWPAVDTAYVSYPANDPAAEALAGALGAREVSSTTAWQRLE
ncbi:GNAT family N-acetyltransferase [Corynebacterium timonense]|uniref:Protein N-acetyltransferase, RimJ/RimL family n=1 Tax=Corynebacterium timonense TaxID=441500 RepID=A0A1H1N9W0_9CORY|nr:GNAT family N-acetyltransferase [Corynebacterium timonense]SDR95660.1 Protein N-acetyltransferase, RimJ/RimL family [Corynebacterium timonense]